MSVIVIGARYVLHTSIVLLGLGVTCANAQVCTPSVGMIAFGAYNALSPQPTDTIATVTVTCTGPVSATVAYQIKFVGDDSRPRSLSAPSGQTVYQLYINPARTVVWGDCMGGTSCVSDSFVIGKSTSRRTYTVYGRIPPHQRVPPGNLHDMIIALLTY